MGKKQFIIIAAVLALFFTGCNSGSGKSHATGDNGIPPSENSDSCDCTFYVSHIGSGTECSEANPCDFDYGKANAQPGDVVCLMSGDYGDKGIDENDSLGDSVNWITYCSWPDDPGAEFTSLYFNGSDTDLYLRFHGVYFDSGFESSAKHTLELNHVNYIEFDSCYFEGTKIAGNEINNGDFAPYSFADDAIIFTHYTTPSDYITVKNCEFKYGYNAIRVQGDNWTISNNDISLWTDNAVQIAGGFGNHTEIVNNRIYHNSRRSGFCFWYGTPVGDWSDKQWQTVTQDNTGASGIFDRIQSDRFYIFSDDDEHVPSRASDDIWRLDADPDAIYWNTLVDGSHDDVHNDAISIEGTGTDIVVRGNYLYDNMGQCIKIGANGGSAGTVLFENNLIYDETAPTYLIIFEAGDNIGFYNNIVDAGSDHPLRGLRPYGSLGNLDFYNNIISGAVYNSGTISSDHNIWNVAPPAEFNAGVDSQVVGNFDSGLFIDRYNDYRTADGSPAIDHADPAYAPATDLSGNSRDANPDIGAYEYIP